MRWITYLYTLIWDIPIWILIILMWALWGTKLQWNEGLWFELKKGSCFYRSIYEGWGGTTLGHGGWYAPHYTGGKGIDQPVEFHEHVHVEQYEAGMLRSFIWAVAVFILLFKLGHLQEAIIAGLAFWFSGGLMTWIPNWLQAKVRGEKAYLGSHHEEAAYARTREWKPPK